MPSTVCGQYPRKKQYMYMYECNKCKKYLYCSLSTIYQRQNFKQFAGYTTNVTQKLRFDMEKVENIAVKRENGGHHHFLLFPVRIILSSAYASNLD